MDKSLVGYALFEYLSGAVRAAYNTVIQQEYHNVPLFLSIISLS